jgi:SAM-dependent methyltransferase
MLTFARRLVPRPIKAWLKRHIERRRASQLFGPLADMVPPVEEMFDGPGSVEEFKRNGDEFLEIYKNICDLKQNERVLDVGSGLGRKSIPLTNYLSAGARYDGIDVNRIGVEWCRSRITPRFPAFQFQQIDAFNRLYNPTGTVRASEYRFPFADRSFTFVTVQSVFTHMLPEGIERYLAEVARVLDSGRCLASFFLLNDESRAFIARGESDQRFLAEENGWATTSVTLPESAIALDETIVRSLFAKAGLEIVACYPGAWCGRRNALTYQDLLLAIKP